MDQTDTLIRLGVAFAIGLLVGIERGWQLREEAEGERAAGLRTFALIGLSGGVWGLLTEIVGPAPLGLAFLVIAGAVTLFRWRETERQGTLGATTVMAAFLTFALGAYATLGDMTVAAAAGVATAALLAAKHWLHGWVRLLTWSELRATLTLLAMTFVALPVLPDQGYGPYEALNPYRLWLMTIALAGVSFIGYVAVKFAGSRYGSVIAGVAGGLVSSTAATLDMARRTRAAPSQWRPQLAGALAASAVMFVRVGVIVALFGPALLATLAAPLAVAAIASIAVAVAVSWLWASASAEGTSEGAAFRYPFNFWVVLGFAALLALIFVLTASLTEIFGGRGAVFLAAVAGLADVDAITLSMTQSNEAASGTAVLAILVAVAANSLSKSVLAIAIGGRRFGLAYFGVTAAALAAAAVVFALLYATG